MHRERRTIDNDDDSETDAVAAAARKAVARAVAEHKRAGNPIAVWENGQVRWVPADEIVVNDDES